MVRRAASRAVDLPNASAAATAVDALARRAAAATPLSNHALANGLRVVVLEDHRAPVVAHALWYRAGSIDEQSGATGIAHVLEHMMFNGTHRYGPGEFDQQMRSLGASANALTWTDYTAYTVEAPAHRLAEVMALEAERMTGLQITDVEFDREIRVVMEERRQSSDDDPGGALYESLYACAFHASPQRWPIIGWMSDLAAMRADDARAWYAQWYCPNNAVLVVAGDVVPEQVFVLAETHFGSIPTVALPARRPQAEPPQRGIRRIETRAYTPAAQVAIGFKAPRLCNAAARVSMGEEGGEGSKAVKGSKGTKRRANRVHAQSTGEERDVYALAVLAELLDWGRLLEKTVVRRKRLADEVWSSYDYLMRAPGLFTLGAVCADNVSPARVERALRGVVADVARDGVDEASLQRVRMQLIASRLYRTDSVQEQADEIGRLAMLGFEHDARHIEARLAAVTTAQVREVASRYFGDDGMTVAVLLPEVVSE